MSSTLATPALVTCAQCNRPGFIPKTDGNVPVHNEKGTRCPGSNQPPRGAGTVTPTMTMTVGPEPAASTKLEKRERPKGVPRLAIDRPARVGDVVVAMHHGRAIWRGNVTAISASGTGVTIRNGGTEGVYAIGDVWVVKAGDAAPAPAKPTPATSHAPASDSSAPDLVHVTCARCRKELLAQADTLEIPKHKNPKGKDCKGAGDTTTLSPQAEIPVEPAPVRPRGAQSGLGALLPDASRTSQPDHGRSVLVDVALIDENNEMKRIPIDQATVEGLVESIPELGLIQPVTLVQRGERYELMDGRHRTLAYRRLLDATKDADAWGKIPSIVRRDLDEKSEKAVAGAANQVRRSTTPYEEAIYFKAQRDAGLSLSEIAKRAGIKSHNTISNRLRLLELPEDLAKRAGTDWFGEQHASAVATVIQTLGPKAERSVRAAIKRADQDDWDRDADDFRHAVISELQRAGLLWEGGYREQDALKAAMSKPGVKDRVDAIPKIEMKTGSGKHVEIYYADPKAIDQILHDEGKRAEEKTKTARREEKAEKTPAQRAAEKQETERARMERKIEDELLVVEREVLVGAAKKVTDFDARILAIMAREFFAFAGDEVYDDDRKEMARLLDVDEKALSKIMDAKASDLLRMIRGKDKVIVARVIAATELVRDPGHGEVAKELVKIDRAKLRAEAKKRVEAREAPAKPSAAAYVHGGYSLYVRSVTLKGGRKQEIYFFSKGKPKTGTPAPLPAGYECASSTRTGLPILRRVAGKKGGKK